MRKGYGIREIERKRETRMREIERRDTEGDREREIERKRQKKESERDTGR